MLTKNTTTKTPDKPNASWGCSEKETVWFRPPNDYSTRILCIDFKQNKLKKY